MKCNCCGKEITPDEALTCEFCGKPYCAYCAASMGICDCYGDFKLFS